MLEEALNAAISGTAAMDAMCRYDGAPAVFCGDAPNDQSPGWDGAQFPRCMFGIDWMYEPERLKAGVLTVDVITVNTLDENVIPEDVAAQLVNELSGMFFSGADGVYSVVWSRTDSFVSGDEPRELGATLVFDLLGYPVAQPSGHGGRTSPNPVGGVTDYIAAACAGATVIGGAAELPASWLPTDIAPTLYARLNGVSSPVRASAAVTWLRAEVVVHIMSPAWLTWAQFLADQVALDAEVICRDGSPMLIKSVTVSTAAHPAQVGQLTIIGEYGVIHHDAPTPTLEHINIQGGLYE